ncbi:MAG: fumarate hydratase, partial [Coriobacteriales bacterium]|nr:fumarate hydratase [Coriobacteriales bacterium]
EVGSENPREDLRDFERELMREVNATGIGPGGFGGDTTALAVHVETAPCHIAALPVAVNMGCSAMRSVSIDLLKEQS